VAGGGSVAARGPSRGLKEGIPVPNLPAISQATHSLAIGDRYLPLIAQVNTGQANRPDQAGIRPCDHRLMRLGNIGQVGRLLPAAPKFRHYPLGSTTTVTSGVIPEKTLTATLYVPSDLSGSSRSILCRSTSMPRRASASAMSFDVIEP
jgi:hypothetical protein